MLTQLHTARTHVKAIGNNWLAKASAGCRIFVSKSLQWLVATQYIACISHPLSVFFFNIFFYIFFMAISERCGQRRYPNILYLDSFPVAESWNFFFWLKNHEIIEYQGLKKFCIYCFTGKKIDLLSNDSIVRIMLTIIVF